MDEGSKRLLTLQRVVRERMPTPLSELQLPAIADRTERILTVVDAVDGWVSEFDHLGRMLYASPNVEAVLGYTPDECLNTDCVELHPEDLPAVLAAGKQLRSTGKPARSQARFRHKAGNCMQPSLYSSVSTSPVNVRNGNSSRLKG